MPNDGAICLKKAGGFPPSGEICTGGMAGIRPMRFACAGLFAGLPAKGPAKQANQSRLKVILNAAPPKGESPRLSSAS
jgi:hypothetical protein